MKKNEFATFLVYVAMLVIAVLVGFLVIRPAIAERWNSNNAIVFVIVFIIAGVIINALLLEIGHFLGAKAGHYLVVSWNVLGLSFKKSKGKWKFGFSGFDGLTGETKIVPKDIEKSTLVGVVAIPLLLYLVEVIVCIILMAVSQRNVAFSGNSSDVWLEVFAVVLMAIGGMIYLYDYFPAHLDSETDGYRMVAFNKKINREAYNRMALNAYKLSEGEAVRDDYIYEDITDFTAEVNMVKVYAEIDRGDINKALEILQLTIDTDNRISEGVRNNAIIMKLSLVLLTKKRDVGAKYYENVENEQRKYIAQFDGMPSLRSYLLVSGLIENSEAETNYALEKALRILKKNDETTKETETKLLKLTIQRVATLHPSWHLVLDKELNPVQETKAE